MSRDAHAQDRDYAHRMAHRRCTWSSVVATRTMKVRFSYDIFRLQRHGGVSRYVTELHSGLLERGVDSKILAMLHRNSYLMDRDGVVGLDVDRLRPLRLRQGLTKITDRGFERLWAPRQSYNTIYHKTYFDDRVPVGPRLAVTVYDMIHERFPNHVSSRDLTVRSKRIWCEQADVVFCISSTTRDDLLDRYDVDPDRVVVTPLGVRFVVPQVGAVPASQRPYILYVGERQSYHKNFGTLVTSFAKSGVADHLDLVCFGGGAFTSAEVSQFRAHGVQATQRSGTDAILAAYYEAAICLVYPSLYEGFGLPLLEAMLHGCPVLTSNAGSIPEVAGDAAAKFDPTDVEEMTASIRKIVDDEMWRRGLIASGRRHADVFTWNAAVEKTIAGYERVIS